MPNTIQQKRSTVAGVVPAAASLLVGQLAVNSADKKLWVGDGGGNPVLLTGSVAARDLTISSSSPSGGADGDLWLMPEEQDWLVRLADADMSRSNVATAQDWFSSLAGVDVAIGTYEFEGQLRLSHGATTHTTGTLFAGSATVSWVEYFAMLDSAAAAGIATAQSTKWSSAATNQVQNATATPVETRIWIQGLIRFSAAGRLVPQFQFSADPTGTILTKRGSIFKMRRLGDGGFVSNGPWS